MPEAAPVMAKSWPLILCGGSVNVLCGYGLAGEPLAKVAFADMTAGVVMLWASARECVTIRENRFGNITSDVMDASQ
jgi:hypothetical protein